MEKAALGAGTKATTAGDNEAIKRGNKYHAHIYKVLRLEWILNYIPAESPWELVIEPWFRTAKWKLRSPDTVLLNKRDGLAVVVEVKMNWKDGRDVKLLTEYLPIVKSAYDLKRTFPALITGNVRGLRHPPLLSLADLIPAALGWKPGLATPTLLHVKKV
jgi:hypothetical protein